MDRNEQSSIKKFLAALQVSEKAYVQATLNYIAFRKSEKFILSVGRLFLTTSVPNVSEFNLETENVKAARINLAKLGLTTQTFIEALANTGSITTPQGDFIFAPNGSRTSATFIPLHPDGLAAQQRYTMLRLHGAELPQISQTDIDWELKAADTPYDGLTELLNDLNLTGFNAPTCTFEVLAFNIAAIDAANSVVRGNTAAITSILARGLKPELTRIGYRVYVPGAATQRGVIDGAQIRWTEESGAQRGFTELPVSPSAIVNCTTIYAVIAQSHYWISDPDRVQNPRRAVYETFDPKLERLRSTLTNSALRGQDARQLEASIAWLAWLLGFSVVHLGGMPRSQDAADVLLSTPGGHYGIVECTIGLLKAENKLALLHARCEAVKAKLRDTGNTFQRVLPIIISSKSKTELKPDIEAAERLGILVLTKEDIEKGIERTLNAPNADQIFAEAEQAVRTAEAKYAAEPFLPLGAPSAT